MAEHSNHFCVWPPTGNGIVRWVRGHVTQRRVALLLALGCSSSCTSSSSDTPVAELDAQATAPVRNMDAAIQTSEGDPSAPDTAGADAAFEGFDASLVTTEATSTHSVDLDASVWSTSASSAATSTNEPAFSCNYDTLLRHYRVTALADGDFCLDARFELAEGAPVESRPCRGSDPQHFRLALRSDCSFALQLQWGEAPYAYTWCLGFEGDGAELTACEAAPGFTLESLDDSTFHVMSEAGLCLTLPPEEGARALLGDCATASQLSLDVSPTEAQPLTTTPDAAPVEVSPTNGGGLRIDSPIRAGGFGLETSDDRVRWVDAREDFEATFAFRIQWESDYLLSFIAASGFDDAAIDVTLGNDHLGEAVLRKTAELNDYQRSRAVKLGLTGLDHVIGLRNGGGKPFGLADVVVWPVNGRLPDFGAVHAVDAAGATVLPTAAISDMYRSQLDDEGAEPHWTCGWTFCFIEYDVVVERPGTYELTLEYRTYDQFTGALVLIGGIQFADVPFPAVAEGGPFAWSTPVTVTLAQGSNNIRLQHGDYLYEGMLSGHYAVRNLRLMPTND